MNQDVSSREYSSLVIAAAKEPWTYIGAGAAHLSNVAGKAGQALAALKLGKTYIDVNGQSVELAPGINVTAEIKTGKRRVIEYLLSPIQRAGSESFRER